MARCLKIYLYIHWLVYIIIHLSTFYQPLKNNSQSYAQTKIKRFPCTKFVIAPIKGFWLITEMQECTTVFISQEKDKGQSQKCKKTCQWKLIFVICSYGTWARRHAKHARHIGKWSRRHTRHVGTNIQGTLAHEHKSKQGV